MTHEQLVEAKRAIDSLLSKSRRARATLLSRDKHRYKRQITLLTNRINALKISSTLIKHAIAAARS